MHSRNPNILGEQFSGLCVEATDAALAAGQDVGAIAMEGMQEDIFQDIQATRKVYTYLEGRKDVPLSDEEIEVAVSALRDWRVETKEIGEGEYFTLLKRRIPSYKRVSIDIPPDAPGPRRRIIGMQGSDITIFTHELRGADLQAAFLVEGQYLSPGTKSCKELHKIFFDPKSHAIATEASEKPKGVVVELQKLQKETEFTRSCTPDEKKVVANIIYTADEISSLLAGKSLGSVKQQLINIRKKAGVENTIDLALMLVDAEVISLEPLPDINVREALDSKQRRWLREYYPKKNVETAKERGVTPKTISNKWSQIYDKLGGVTRLQAVLMAYRDGVL